VYPSPIIGCTATNDAQISLATVVVSWVILGLLLVLLVFAYPAMRAKFHDSFDLTHRFLGWTSVALVWEMALFFRPPPPPPAPTSFSPPTSDLIAHFENTVVEPIQEALNALRIWFQEANEENDPIRAISQRHHFTTRLLELFEDDEPQPLWSILYPPSRFQDNLLKQLQFIRTGVDNLANNNLNNTTPPAHTADVIPTLAAMEANIVSLQEKTLTSLKSYADAAKAPTPKPPPSSPPPTKTAQPKPTAKKNSLPQAVICVKGKIDNKSRPSFTNIVTNLNKSLHDHPKHSHVRVVGVKWTASSNLVVRAQAPSPASLVSALKAVQASIVDDQLKISDIIPNARWSRMTLSHVFTGKDSDSPAFSPEAIHEELSTYNPTYSLLTIRQLPSWIRNPKNFSDGQISSITFAFEDPDGSKARQLAGSSLTAFGNLRCTLKTWITPKNSQQKAQQPAAADH
jgi:hypothetical protein